MTKWKIKLATLAYKENSYAQLAIRPVALFL